MLSESVQRRRMAYKRSRTLSTLPTHLVQEVELEDDSPNERSKLITSTDSPIHCSGSTPNLNRVMLSQENTPLVDKQQNSKQKKKKTSGTSSKTTSGPANPVKSDNGVQRSTSCVDNSRTANTSGSRTKLFGRTPSTPSIILNKVKDRIREKMFQTSTDWSHGAAIIQERRQRSVDAFQARRTKSRKSLEKEDIEIEQIPLKDIHKKKRARMKSDPIPAVVLTNADEFTPAEAARLAFRRRSISEDTYDRRPCLPKVKLSNPENTAGIICSNEDLQAIADISRTGYRKSPQSNKRSSLEPQGSIESSSSTYSSRSARALSFEADLSPSERPDVLALRGTDDEDVNTNMLTSFIGTASAGHKPFYAEVVVEKKSKEDIVKRSSSITSGASGSLLHHLSPAGSKNSLSSDRRMSENKDSEDKKKIFEKSESSSTANENEDNVEDGKPKPIPEVVFDEFGQTWDVYGAEFDPEMVGDAIQRHLVKMMQRKQEESRLRKLQQLEEEEQHKQGKGNENMSFLLRFLCLFNNRRQTPSS